ncbi:MAG: sugar ABC transporter substrate-binding protein [Candidatus Eisenbacteria bacterium]
MMRRLRRLGPIAAVVLLALAAVLAGACARSPKKQQVVFWITWPIDAVRPIEQRYEALHKDINVKLVVMPWEGLRDSLAAALAAGNPPDLCQMHSTDLPPFLSGSSLSDWSAGVADLRPALRGWPMVMVGDAIYGLPWLLRTQVLYWNRDLFFRAKLGPARGPQTWDELRQAATAIQRLRDGVHGYGLAVTDSGATFRAVLPYLLSNGGSLMTEEFDSSRVDSPENLQALEFVQSLRPSTLLASDDSLAREFEAGRLGLLLAGSELGVRLQRSGRGPRYGVELVPRPAPERGARTALAAGEVLVSFTNSHHKEDALRLARFLVQDDNALALATLIQFMQPASVTADTAAWYRTRPEQQIMFRQLASVAYLPQHRDWAAMHRVLANEFGAAIGGWRGARAALAVADTFVARRLESR